MPIAASLMAAVQARLAAGQRLCAGHAQSGSSGEAAARSGPSGGPMPRRTWWWPMATRSSGCRGWRGGRWGWCRGRTWWCRWCRRRWRRGGRWRWWAATEAALAGAAAHLQADWCRGWHRAGPLIAPPRGFDPEGPEARAILARVAAAWGPACACWRWARPSRNGWPRGPRAWRRRRVLPGMGAGVDFLAGAQARAPDWVRALALEWLWRMLRQPRRMVPRYAACAAILPPRRCAPCGCGAGPKVYLYSIRPGVPAAQPVQVKGQRALRLRPACPAR
jgi:exopolysaccharide biosynthesis WecB/TagA/CpsF family protein